MSSSRTTIQSFEWARAFGALAVVVLHVCGSSAGVDALAEAAPAFFGAEELVLLCLGRWAVPVFLMMSGALMLDPARPMPPGKLARHAWRVAFVLLTFGLGFCLIEAAYEAGMVLSPQLVGQALVNLLVGRSWDHLWYLYALLGLYAATPALRWVLCRLRIGGACLLVACLWALGCGVPTLAYLAAELGVGAPVVGPLAQALAWLFPACYYVGGHVLFQLVRRGRGERFGRVVGMASLVALALMLADEILGEGLLQLPEYALVLPFGLGVFLLVMRRLERPVGKHPAVALVARYSFGIYVVHPLFLHLLVRSEPLVWGAASLGALGVVLFEVLTAALCIVASIGVVRVARLLPGFEGKL